MGASVWEHLPQMKNAVRTPPYDSAGAPAPAPTWGGAGGDTLSGSDTIAVPKTDWVMQT
jgi:hypothetical protein